MFSFRVCVFSFMPRSLLDVKEVFDVSVLGILHGFISCVRACVRVAAEHKFITWVWAFFFFFILFCFNCRMHF